MTLVNREQDVPQAAPIVEPARPADAHDVPQAEPIDHATVQQSITAEGRLLERGWEPASDTILANVLRREALRQAVDRLKPGRVQSTLMVEAAIATGDPAIVEAAITNHAVGTWLDMNCQRDQGDLIVWLAQLENGLRREVYRRPEPTLASLEAFVDDVDARYLRGVALGSLERQSRTIGPGGKPMPPPDPPGLSFMELMIPR